MAGVRGGGGIQLELPRRAGPRRLTGRRRDAEPVLRLAGRDFRTFAHPPAALLAVLGEHGLHVSAAHRGRLWEVAAVAR